MLSGTSALCHSFDNAGGHDHTKYDRFLRETIPSYALLPDEPSWPESDAIRKRAEFAVHIVLTQQERKRQQKCR